MKGASPSRFGLSSLGVFFPRFAIETWLGRRPAGDRVLVTHLFNHTPTAVDDGWSVRKTHVRDFRGRTLTYDSHNGTDFTCPVGTAVVAPAPGRVVRVSSEFHRGGLKVVVDHGAGLMTSTNNLVHGLVTQGQEVQRGEPLALSGASGLDGVVAFPWNGPHVHFNTWLDGVAVDPFATDPLSSLWRGGLDPRPGVFDVTEAPLPPTAWDLSAIEALIASCLDPVTRAELNAITDPQLRSANTVFLPQLFPDPLRAWRQRGRKSIPAYPHP